MNELMWDLDLAAPWLNPAPRRAPDAVAALWCRPTRAGGLMFAWQRPRGRAHVAGYRLERTRDGKDYEEIAEAEAEGIGLPPLALGEGWVYPVSAFNSWGQGPPPGGDFHLRRRRD